MSAHPPDEASSSPTLRAILKDDGETSMVEPSGKLRNRGDDSPNNEDAAVGVGDRTRLRRGYELCTLLLLLLLPIITSCHPVSFFLWKILLGIQNSGRGHKHT